MSDDAIKEMFKTIKLDEDTRLLGLRYGHLAGLPVRQERWSWDGLKGETVVFRTADVSSKSDEDLQSFIRDELNVSGEVTIKRKSEFVFVNHSFVA